MAIVFVPFGWSNKANADIFDPSSNDKIDLWPEEGAQCYHTVETGASTDVFNHVDPIYQGTKDSFIPMPTWWYHGNIKGNAIPYFGGAYQGTIDPPGPVRHDLGRKDVRTASKMKDFVAAKARGEIVIQPIDTSASIAVCRPGVITTGPSERVRIPRHQYGAFPTKTSKACPGRMGTSFPSFPGMISSQARGRDQQLSNIWSVLDKYTTGSDPWYLPSREEARMLADEVLSATGRGFSSTNLVTSALAEANNKHWDILTEIAELPETIKYIVRTLRNILRFSSNFRKELARIRKRKGKVRGLADELTSSWLEYRYAVMPLIYSVEDALKYLSTYGVEYQTTRKREIRLVEFDIPGWTIEPVTVYDRCFIKRRFTLDADGYSSSRFLTTNALLTAWELRRLSFVVDWVFNIGDFVTSLAPPSGVIQQGSMLSHQIPRNLSVTCSSKNYTGASVVLSLGRYHAYEINPLCHIGVTTSVHLNWKRALDAISLYWQITKRSYN